MSQHPERQPGGNRESGRVCRTCGGRGALRQGDESYRTCMECLGQGLLPGLEAATTTAALLNKGPVLLQSASCGSDQQAVKGAATAASR